MMIIAKLFDQEGVVRYSLHTVRFVIAFRLADPVGAVALRREGRANFLFAAGILRKFQENGTACPGPLPGKTNSARWGFPWKPQGLYAIAQLDRLTDNCAVLFEVTSETGIENYRIQVTRCIRELILCEVDGIL